MAQPSGTSATLMAVAASTSATSRATSTSGAGSSSDAVIEFRLKNGLCHSCGTRIYEVAEGGRVSPLTVQGIVLFGRCLFCYRDPEPQQLPPSPRRSKMTTPRFKITSTEGKGGKHHKRKAFCATDEDKEGTISVGCGRRRKRSSMHELCREGASSSNSSNVAPLPDGVSSSSVARLPPSSSAVRASSPEEVEDCDLAYSSSKSLPPDCGCDKDEQDGRDGQEEEEAEPDEIGMRVEIRDYQRYLFVGTLLEGTRRKGRGNFRYVYKKGEHKGKEAEYQGEFENGRMQGHGTSRDAAGCVYEGTFCRGAAHGYGSCTWSEQWRYEGQWEMDRREGKGTLQQLVEDGEVYTGDWKQDQWHGKGNLKFAGGGRYVGDFKHHKLDGIGKYEFADGSIYEGSFKNDMRSGIGTMVYEDGTKYSGEWKNNWREGKGTLFQIDGSVFKGTFVGDEKLEGVVHLGDGIMRRERYVDGVLQQAS